MRSPILYIAIGSEFPTRYGGQMVSARLKVLDDRSAEGLGSPRVDIWRTVSGWIWAAYLVCLAAAVWLFF